MSSYSVPIDASFYDNLPNGFYHMPYTSQFGSQAEAVSQESYYLPPTGGEPVPSYPTYNGLPPFQTPPLLPSTTPSVEAPASWEPSWNHSSGSVSDDLSQLQPNAVTAVAQHGTRRRGSSSRLATYSRRTTSSRRTKIKKASCTGYAAKLVRSFQTRLGIQPLRSCAPLQRKSFRWTPSRPS
jgi:hypothetical protein